MTPKLAISMLLAVMVGCLSSPVARSEEPPASILPDKALESEAAKTRIKRMMDALKEYSVEVSTDEGPVKATLQDSPALRWSNPLSRVQDGIVNIWSRDGRPEVVVKFYTYGGDTWVHEFRSVSRRPLIMKRHGTVVWSPRSAGVEFHSIPNAPATAADSPIPRLIQMRKLAERFEFIYDFHPFGDDLTTIERHPLRLLPKPIYRYEASGDLIDGALFVYSLATAPPAMLMIEARSTPAGVDWQYALVPVTVYGLTARLDDREIWNRPETLKWRFDEPFYPGFHR